jgi:ABC-type nitrate/sulfonate/bicarbonate transport system permease component
MRSAIRAVSGTGETGQWRSAASIAIGLGVFLGSWELSGRWHLLGPYWIPLSTVLDRILTPGSAGLFQRALWSTTASALIGYGLGVGLAVALGVAVSVAQKAREPLFSAVVVMSAIPVLAVGPLFVAILQRPLVPVAIAAQTVFFATFIAVLAGFDSSRPAHQDLFDSLGASRVRNLRYLRAPSSVPAFLTGLKVAVPTALVGAMVGEWFGSERGLGVLLLSAMQNFQIPLLWAAAVLGSLASIVAYGLVAIIEWRLTPLFRD